MHNQPKRSYSSAPSYSTRPIQYTSAQSTTNLEKQSAVSEMKSSLTSGFGAGIGMNLADRMVSSMFGNRTVNIVSQPAVVESPNSSLRHLSLDTQNLSSECQSQKQIYHSVKDILHLVKEEKKDDFRKCGFIN